MDLLISTLDLREVVPPTPVAPLPGRPRGIQGVVFYQGEFLPVLAWEDLPGGRKSSGQAVAMAVLRPRLGLPIERIIGIIGPPAEAWREPSEQDLAMSWLGAACRLENLELRALDPDRLVALLHRFREER